MRIIHLLTTGGQFAHLPAGKALNMFFIQTVDGPSAIDYQA